MYKYLKSILLEYIKNEQKKLKEHNLTVFTIYLYIHTYLLSVYIQLIYFMQQSKQVKLTS